jgi:hypothetical protein
MNATTRTTRDRVTARVLTVTTAASETLTGMMRAAVARVLGSA